MTQIEFQALLAGLENDQCDEGAECDVDAQQHKNEMTAAGGLEQRPWVPNRQHEDNERSANGGAQQQMYSRCFPARHSKHLNSS